MLDQVDRWDRRLNDDEKQCLAFARIILQKPRWVVLDGALDVLDPLSRKRIEAIFNGRFGRCRPDRYQPRRNPTTLFTPERCVSQQIRMDRSSSRLTRSEFLDQRDPRQQSLPLNRQIAYAECYRKQIALSGFQTRETFRRTSARSRPTADVPLFLGGRSSGRAGWRAIAASGTAIPTTTPWPSAAPGLALMAIIVACERGWVTRRRPRPA